MDRNLTWPAFGAVLLAAAAFGVHIGQSAIDHINPLYFQGPAVHPRDRGTVVTEASLEAQGPRFADLYGWDEGDAARTADCVDCDALAARDSYAGGVQLAVVESGWSAEVEPAALVDEPEGAVAAEESRDDGLVLQRAEIDRYLGFEIEQGRGGKQPAAESDDTADPVAIASIQE